MIGRVGTENGGAVLKKLKSLDRYQKGVLLFMIVMVLVFTAAYFVITSRKGFAYGDAILIPREENGSTVYSGKIRGNRASFTVSGGKTVEFQYGDKIYGPYIYQEDPAAVPEDSELKDSMIGVELRRGDRILFRGGMLEGDSRWLYNEDGSPEGSGFLTVTNTGIMTDENGNIIDPMEPPVSVLLDLLTGPELTNQGNWSMWLLGVFACAVTGFTILFADELFRWKLSFLIQNADGAQPSDWEIMGRYSAWTVLPVLALLLFVLGLQ